MNRKTMVIAIGILLGFCAGIHFYAEWQKAKFDASLPEPPAPEGQAAETEGGHWHGDEWHAEPHNVNFVTPIVEPPEVDFSVQPTAAPETESDAQFPATLEEILATPKYVERLRIARRSKRNDPAYGKWFEERILIEAEGELLEREEPYPTPKGGESAEELETLVRERLKWINSMTEAERLAMADKIIEYGKKRDAWWERLKAHDAKAPSLRPSAEILESWEENQ